MRVCQRDIVNKLEVNFLCAFFLKTNLAGLKLDSSNYGEKWILKDIFLFSKLYNQSNCMILKWNYPGGFWLELWFVKNFNKGPFLYIT